MSDKTCGECWFYDCYFDRKAKKNICGKDKDGTICNQFKPKGARKQ